MIGTSTGGLDALKRLLAPLPEDLPAAILVVMHTGPHESVLPKLLQPVCRMPVRHAPSRTPIKAGEILIAPSNHHLVVEQDSVGLSSGAKENYARPAIDPLFRSAAIFQRERVIGIIMTGELDDGTVGLQAVKAYGGIAIVQDPTQAVAASMPASAIEHVDVDYCLPIDAIAARLTELVAQPVRSHQLPHPPSALASLAEFENRSTLRGLPPEESKAFGNPSMLTCPECSGSLLEFSAPGPLRFRCHTGHAYTAQALAMGQDRSIEEALWSAVRALHEREILMRRSAQNAMNNQRESAAKEHLAAASKAARDARIPRQTLTGSASTDTPMPEKTG